jgi:transposase InsO family protein
VELDRLAAKAWRHPTSGEWIRCARSTIERWYYQALAQQRDPVGALARKVRRDRGTWPSMRPELLDALTRQYRDHPEWSCQLHVDNLTVVAEQQPALGPMPSYRTILRFMRCRGLVKRRRRGPASSPGGRRAEQRFEQREVRSYESTYTNALWHLDYHHGSVRVLLANGTWAYPVLLGIMDDHSRLCCHAQWYQTETAENLVHGLMQAIMKRGLPRALMSDNGSAMLAAETTQGLERLGIVHETTLPYSPYQNGKQESFWGQVEGRLLAMIGQSPDVTLTDLNEATLAWIEMEYNRSAHSQLGRSPLGALATGPLSASVLPRRQGRGPPGAAARSTGAGLHRTRHAHPAALGRHRERGRQALRNPRPLRPSAPDPPAGGLVGPVSPAPVRSNHRRRACQSLPARQAQKRRCATAHKGRTAGPP